MCNIITVNQISEIRKAVDNLTHTLFETSATSEECEYKIKLVLNELLTNSFKYAGSDIMCVIKYKLKMNNLYISISDNGKGFIPKWDEINSEIMRESGRGIYLVSCMSEDLRYNKKGNVVLVKLTID